MLRRPAAGRKVRPLDPHGQTRTRLSRPLLRPLGIPRRLHRQTAAGSPHLHRPPRRSRPHAPWPISSLHVPGLLAVVLRLSVFRHEARRKLAWPGQIFPSIRRSNWSRTSCRDNLVRLVPLAKPHDRHRINGGRASSPVPPDAPHTPLNPPTPHSTQPCCKSHLHTRT